MNKESNKIIVIGLGESARLAYEYFSSGSNYEIECFAVEKEFLDKSEFCKKPVIDLNDTKKLYPEINQAFVAISGTNMNRVRERMFLIMKASGYKLVNYVSQNSLVWRDVQLGENCCIVGKSVIESGCKIGDNVTVWNATVAHSSVVEDNVFLAINSTVCGFTTIKKNSFIGANSTVGDGLIGSTVIGEFNFIKMGTAIAGKTANGATYGGGHIGFIK